MFLDFFGFGMIIPVVPVFFKETSTILFGAEIPIETRSTLYGLMMGFYTLSTFFFAPWLGSLSDRLGRKPVLLITNLSNGLGYILSGFGVLLGNPFLFIFARVFPGISGSSVFIVQSAFADLSEKDKKAGNLGLVGVAFGAGTILGALVGGLLSKVSSPAPFFAAACLSATNLLFVRFVFIETLKLKKRVPLNFWLGAINIKNAFTHPDLRLLFITIFTLVTGFSFFIQFLPLHLTRYFNMEGDGIGLVYGFLGLIAALVQGGLVRIFEKRISPNRLLSFTLIFFSISYLPFLFLQSKEAFFVFAPILMLFQSLSFPNLLAMISNRASAEDQGKTIGINQSLQSLGASLSSFLAAFSISLDSKIIFVVGSVCALMSWTIFFFGFRNSDKKN